MCALLQLTPISSIVSVTKPARLSREMGWLWLTAHVWILYFESHAALSNTGCVKAFFTPVPSAGAMLLCTADHMTLNDFTFHTGVGLCVKSRRTTSLSSSVLLSLGFGKLFSLTFMRKIRNGKNDVRHFITSLYIQPSQLSSTASE